MRSYLLLSALLAIAVSSAHMPEAFAAAPPPPPPAGPPFPLPTPLFLRSCWGGIACVDGMTLSIRMNDALFAAAGLIALAIFLVGAFMMVISAGSDQLLQSAKRAMKYSLIGLAVVTGSYGIYRTVVFLLYP